MNRALLAKEWRALVSSRATLVFALAVGPLVGHAFITAVNTYGEMSGLGGGPAALAQGLSPLDGILVPTFGAYAIAATLLFPFVAIWTVSADKESGALDLLVQSRFSIARQLAAKFITLLLLWLVAWSAGALAFVLWLSYGGHLHGPELAAVLLGHLMRAGVIGAVSLVAAAIGDSAATAAVVALAFTLGTWALDFVAAVQGGLAKRLAAFTPDAALRTFERGEVSLAVAGVSLIALVGFAVLAGIWLHPGRPARARWGYTALVMAAMIALVIPLGRTRGSWDVSEDRRNSFSEADQLALRQIRQPLEVTVYLGPEDPRLVDLDREVLRKLRRTLGNLRVVYAARSGTGLFPVRGEHYGEIWYALGGKREMNRSTTEPIVLEVIYGLAGVTPPRPGDGEAAYPGYPLAAQPRFAGILLYGVWPVVTLLAWGWARRRNGVR